MITPGRWLGLGVAVVAGLGLCAEVGKGALPAPIVEHLSLSYEANLPTWASSSLLLGCAIAAAAVARRATAWRRHWWGVAIGLGYASMDEATEIHEHLGGLFGTGGVLYFDWVIVAAAILVVLSWLYLGFMRALPRATRVGLVVAAAVYVAGAVGMELPLGWWTEQFGNDGLGYALIDWVEETLELIGASLALRALAAHPAETA